MKLTNTTILGTDLFMIKQLFLLSAICFLLFAACKRSGVDNVYYDRMHKLAEDFTANPADKRALSSLEKYAKDGDLWNRIYAYSFLKGLAARNIGGCRSELIPLFVAGLSDSDRSIKREAAQSIIEIGPTAVDEALSALMNIVSRGGEDDFVIFAIRALGQCDVINMTPDIMTVLLKTANTAPPSGTPESAPQSRCEALDAIKALAIRNKINVIPQLTELMQKSEPDLNKRVARLILDLDSNNQAARRFLNK